MILTVICIVFFAPAVSCAQIAQDNVLPDEAASYIHAAKVAEAQKNWTLCNEISNEGVARFPANATLLCINGYSLRKLGLYPEAVEMTTRAIRIDPEPVRYTNRGYAFLALGDYVSAAADARTGIALNASYPDCYGVEALALAGQGNYREALSAADTATWLAPANAHLWEVEGEVLRGSGDYSGAREAFIRSIALNTSDLPWPGYPDAVGELKTLAGTCNRTATAAGSA